MNRRNVSRGTYLTMEKKQKVAPKHELAPMKVAARRIPAPLVVTHITLPCTPEQRAARLKAAVQIVLGRK